MRAGLVVRLALGAVALYYALWGGEYSAFDLRELGRQREEKIGELARVRSEVDSLRVANGRLETDRATIERVARERFGMIREGEILFRFVEVAPAEKRSEALARNP